MNFFLRLYSGTILFQNCILLILSIQKDTTSYYVAQANSSVCHFAPILHAHTACSGHHGRHEDFAHVEKHLPTSPT